MNQLIARKRILIVDDEPDLRALMRAAIDDHYEVYEAADGHAAIGVAETTRPDAVLLDIRLPKASGLIVCQTLKAHPVLAKAPIIMVSLPLGTEESPTGLEVGADFFLPKPFTPQALRAMLEIACSEEPADLELSTSACGPALLPAWTD